MWGIFGELIGNEEERNGGGGLQGHNRCDRHGIGNHPPTDVIVRMGKLAVDLSFQN